MDQPVGPAQCLFTTSSSCCCLCFVLANKINWNGEYLKQFDFEVQDKRKGLICTQGSEPKHIIIITVQYSEF